MKFAQNCTLRNRHEMCNEQLTFDHAWPVDRLFEQSFERFCTEFLTKLFPNATVNRYGDRGHKQHGLGIEIAYPVYGLAHESGGFLMEKAESDANVFRHQAQLPRHSGKSALSFLESWLSHPRAGCASPVIRKVC